MTATLENELKTASAATDSATTKIADHFDVLGKRLKASAGVDDKVLALQSDTSVGRDDVTNNLNGAIQDKDKNQIDSVKIAPIYDYIEKKFEAARIPASPKLIQAIMVSSGYDDAALGGDATYRPNDHIINQYIEKADANLRFTTGDLKESWDAIQNAKNSNLAAALKANQDYTNAIHTTAFANANNAEQADGRIIIRAPEVTNDIKSKVAEADASIRQLEASLGLTQKDKDRKAKLTLDAKNALKLTNTKPVTNLPANLSLEY
jgi:hypothetical protein